MFCRKEPIFFELRCLTSSCTENAETIGIRHSLNSRLNRFKGGCEEAFSLRYTSRRQASEQLAESTSPDETSTTDTDL